MLAKLKKDYETLRNKVRFIKEVINDTINIKKVKRVVIAKELKKRNYLAQSQLNEIQKDEQRATVVRNDEDQDGVEEAKQEEEYGAGEINPAEYDYLLTMPLWSLSEEKIEELNRQMNNKKDDHDNLEATHIHKLWERDLEDFLIALTKQEEKDEKDRLAHKGIVNNGKQGARRKNKPIAKAKPVKGDPEIEDEDSFAPQKQEKTIQKDPKKVKNKTPAKKKKLN